MGRTIASGRTLASTRTRAGARSIRGSGEVVVPLVAYDTTPPAYASGEIGLIDAYTVAITFSEEIVGTNYTTGVTIKKNGVSQTIWYAMRLADHKYVQYVLANPVTSGDTITWEYSVISGNITDIAGNHLLSVSAQTLTNNVAVSTLHYFDNAAGGANNGSSWANAWNSSASINWASVAAGDTVYISGGAVTKTYTETITLSKSGTAGHPITIDVGANSPSPAGHDGIVIIDGGGVRGAGFSANSKNYININGWGNGSYKLQIQGVIEPDGASADIQFQSCSYMNFDYIKIINPLVRGFYTDHASFIRIRGCDIRTGVTVTDNQCNGIYVGSYSTDITVENNYIVLDVDGAAHNDCIQFYIAGRINVRNNWLECGASAGATTECTQFQVPTDYFNFYNNVCIGSPLLGHACQMGGTPTGSGAYYIWNNTMVGQLAGGVALSLYACTDASIGAIKNNIFYTNAGGGITIEDSGPASFTPASKVDYNCYYRPTGTTAAYWLGTSYSWAQWQALGYEAHGVHADPVFTTNFTDMHLQTTSPCKNTGVDLSAYFTTDYERIDRPQGIAWDIGAYEFH